MPTVQSKENAGFCAEFWGGSLDGIASTLCFPMCRRTSLMYVTITGAVLGVTRTTLQQLLGAWNFALCFRRVFVLSRRCLPRRSHASYAPSYLLPAPCWMTSSPVANTLQPCRRTRRARAFQPGLLSAASGTHPVAAALVTPADWSVLFWCRFRTPDHIDELELTALTSLLKHLAN